MKGPKWLTHLFLASTIMMPFLWIEGAVTLFCGIMSAFINFNIFMRHEQSVMMLLKVVNYSAWLTCTIVLAREYLKIYRRSVNSQLK